MEDKKTDSTDKKTYATIKSEFARDVYSAFSNANSEISERNGNIQTRDQFIYGNALEDSIDVPLGHDFTPVNWLRRTVEIHKNMFMSRGFKILSTYDSKDLSTAADKEDLKRLEVENKKEKEYAETRQSMVDAIMRDNGGDALWSGLAENASAVGDSAVKAYYDTENDKFVISPIESIENLYVLWDKDDFRTKQSVAYAYQITKQAAIKTYGVSEDVATSNLGDPLSTLAFWTATVTRSNQPMVTVMEVTGIIPGWCVEKGMCKPCAPGKEEPINALIIGNEVQRLISDKKKIPKYYLFPNKRQRRRPWGSSDVSEAAIGINAAYIETLSDWRTHASKVNFQKYKAYNFGLDSQLPKYESRKVQVLPLSEGQDVVRLDQGDANGLDFRQQMDELKEQFVRETGISRVLFDDPSVTLNSNQALLTSMKPTSDIAEAKKQLWGPIIIELFTDALETIAEYNPEIKEVISEESNWTLKTMWPSVMQKEDPVYQQMLLNRFNAGTMSIQSFVEAQGETKEEIDRIRDEMTDPVTAGILGKQTALIAQTLINAATADVQAWYNSIVAPPELPPEQAGGPQQQGSQIATTQANNQPGQGLVSQPGSGATPVSPGGALAQTQQNNGG